MPSSAAGCPATEAGRADSAERTRMFSAGMAPAYSSGEQGEDLVRDQVRLGEGHQMTRAPRPDVATTGMSACAGRMGLDELLAHGTVPSSGQARSAERRVGKA